MGNYIGKLTQCTLDSTGIVNKYHVFFSVCLYGPILLATPIYYCTVFQWKLNISCIMSCGNKLILTCISVDLLLLHYYILELLLWGNYFWIIIVALWKLWKQRIYYIVCLHSETTAWNMQPWGAGSALIWTIKILKFTKNNIKTSHETENKSILFLLLLHVLKFKIYLIELSLILS